MVEILSVTSQRYRFRFKAGHFICFDCSVLKSGQKSLSELNFCSQEALKNKLEEPA